MYIGPSAATGTAFGHYHSFQIGSQVIDLRGKGGSAAYGTSAVAQPGSGFAGGKNPGVGVTTPLAGVGGGATIFQVIETTGDSIV